MRRLPRGGRLDDLAQVWYGLVKTEHDARMADSDQKLKELILYVADRSVDDPHYGATKLNKILAASDFETYALLGEAVTGSAYQKLEYGPAPRHLKPVQRELIDEGSAQLVPRARASYVQQRLVALRPPNLGIFTAPQIALVDAIIERCRLFNATELSNISHGWDGWLAADLGEDIPYSTAYWSQHALTSDDIERGRALAASVE